MPMAPWLGALIYGAGNAAMVGASTGFNSDPSDDNTTGFVPQPIGTARREEQAVREKEAEAELKKAEAKGLMSMVMGVLLLLGVVAGVVGIIRWGFRKPRRYRRSRR